MKRRLNFIIHLGYAKWDTYPETRVWCKWDTYHETEGVLTCSCYPAKHSFRYTKTFYILLCYDPLTFTTFLSCAFASTSYPCLYPIVPIRYLGSCRQNTATCHILKKLRFCILRMAMHPLRRDGQARLKTKLPSTLQRALNTQDACKLAQHYPQKNGLLWFEQGGEDVDILSQICSITANCMTFMQASCQPLT